MIDMTRPCASKRGFTLIELLVVISIIGLLASIVLAFLSDARTRARENTFKESISSLKTNIENYYTSSLNYDGMCVAGSPVLEQFTRINDNFGVGTVWHTDYGCITGNFIQNGEGFIIYMKILHDSIIQYFCVDSSNIQLAIKFMTAQPGESCS
jgi:prepilin-type N-terminal cleavage/methylation domain-containing protein